MKNKIGIGNSNKINNTIIAGGNITISKPNPTKKKTFWLWIKKHLETIIAAAISGAVSAIVAAIITYYLTK